MNGFVETRIWDYTRPGNWACYASHLAILREAYQKCPTCDLMVYEDDVIFAPNFKQRWEHLLSTLPSDWDISRIGAQSQWKPPFAVTPEYLYSSAVANTWGYVVRAAKVKILADLLAGMPMKGSWGVDAVMQLFNKELKTYSPAVPLIEAASACHDTDVKPGDTECETVEILQRAADQLKKSWPQGYCRRYCKATGVLRTGNQTCLDDRGEMCCPYHCPPYAEMQGEFSEKCP